MGNGEDLVTTVIHDETRYEIAGIDGSKMVLTKVAIMVLLVALAIALVSTVVIHSAIKADDHQLLTKVEMSLGELGDADRAADRSA